MHDQTMHGMLFNPFGYSRFCAEGISNGYSSPKEGEKGYKNYLGGNADLMKYYIYPIPYSNYHSIEYDIKSLIYLSKITLGN